MLYVRHNLKFHTIAMFLIVDLYTIFHTEFVGMVMVCLHTKFQMSRSNGSLIITIKLITKHRFHAAVMFSTVYKKLL